MRVSRIINIIEQLKKIALASDDPVEVVKLGEYYGQMLSDNYIGIYRDDAFEAKLVALYRSKIDASDSCLCDKVLHIISEPYNSGGHTRLFERLVSFNEEANDVLVTRPYQREKLFLKIGENVPVISRPEGFDIKEITEIVSRYKTICMSIHPNDLTTAAAIAIAKSFNKIKVIFINHADHSFSFGLLSADVIAEISCFGYALTEEKREVPHAFLGLPLEIEDYPVVHRKNKASYYLLSAGRSSKYQPSASLSFPHFAKKVLKACPDVYIQVIGPSWTNYWWWDLRILYFRRFRVFNQITHSNYLDALKQADLYVDSFPITGGTALPEARAHGLFITGIDTGATGYTPFDMVRVASIQELVQQVLDFVRGNGNDIEQRNNSDDMIRLAKLVHNPFEVRERFMQILEGEYPQQIQLSSCPDTKFYERTWLLGNTIVVYMNFLRYLYEGNIELRKLLLQIVICMSVSQLARKSYTLLRRLFLRRS